MKGASVRRHHGATDKGKAQPVLERVCSGRQEAIRPCASSHKASKAEEGTRGGCAGGGAGGNGADAVGAGALRFWAFLRGMGWQEGKKEKLAELPVGGVDAWVAVLRWVEGRKERWAWNKEKVSEQARLPHFIRSS